jgi:NAD/NADP transhydrogenase beta subunit
VIYGVTQLTYLAAAALFILSLRWLSHPRTARRGVAAGVGGMALAIIGTLLAPEIINFKWITLAALVGVIFAAMERSVSPACTTTVLGTDDGYESLIAV